MKVLAEKLICFVCGAKGNGNHFGAETCRACAAFFRRTVAHQRKYKCRSNEKCETVKPGRCSCRSCRYNKCLKVGMRAQAVRLSQDKTDRNTESPSEREESHAATKEKSAFTYPNMVFLALENAPNKQAYVSDIYEFLIYNFPFFATTNKSWKNCVRNNISNSQMFEKVPTTEPSNMYRGDMWKVKAKSYEKLLKGVKKTISKYSKDELKLRKDADLDDILAGRAGSKPSFMPKFPSPVPNTIAPTVLQTKVASHPVMPQVPQVPFFPPAGYQAMQFPVYFNHPQFQHHQYPYYHNYNH